MKLKKPLKWHHDFTKDWVSDCFVSENLYYYLRIKDISEHEIGNWNLEVTSLSNVVLLNQNCKTREKAIEIAEKFMGDHLKELMKDIKKVVRSK